MKHILVVEDEEHLAIGIKYNLEAEGYHVTTLGDGPSALALVEDDPLGVDLLILDLMLPGGGFALFESLRDNYQMPRVIMITGSSDLKNRTTAMELGVDGFLLKPFEMETLMEMVRQVLA